MSGRQASLREVSRHKHRLQGLAFGRTVSIKTPPAQNFKTQYGSYAKAGENERHPLALPSGMDRIAGSLLPVYQSFVSTAFRFVT
jgi:hypothetical protein